MKSKKKQPSQRRIPSAPKSLSPIEARSPAAEGLVKTKGVWNPAVLKRIKDLIGDIHVGEQPFENADIVTEIIVTALKAVEAQIGRGDLKLLSRSMRELRYAFKIFKSYRNTRKVTVFGSARTPSI